MRIGSLFKKKKKKGKTKLREIGKRIPRGCPGKPVGTRRPVQVRLGLACYSGTMRGPKAFLSLKFMFVPFSFFLHPSSTMLLLLNHFLAPKLGTQLFYEAFPDFILSSQQC